VAWDLRNFARSQCANRTLRRIQRRVTNFWVHNSSVISLQLSIAATPVNNTRYKRSLHLKIVARQRASLSAQNTILAFLSTLVQKTGGSWCPVPIPSNLLCWTLNHAAKTFRARLTIFDFTGERHEWKNSKSEHPAKFEFLTSLKPICSSYLRQIVTKFINFIQGVFLCRWQQNCANLTKGFPPLGGQTRDIQICITLNRK